MQMFCEEDEEGRTGINAAWKKLAALVPGLLECYGLAFTEADGFFCPTAEAEQ